MADVVLTVLPTVIRCCQPLTMCCSIRVVCGYPDAVCELASIGVVHPSGNCSWRMKVFVLLPCRLQ